MSGRATARSVVQALRSQIAASDVEGAAQPTRTPQRLSDFLKYTVEQLSDSSDADNGDPVAQGATAAASPASSKSSGTWVYLSQHGIGNGRDPAQPAGAVPASNAEPDAESSAPADRDDHEADRGADAAGDNGALPETPPGEFASTPRSSAFSPVVPLTPAPPPRATTADEPTRAAAQLNDSLDNGAALPVQSTPTSRDMRDVPGVFDESDDRVGQRRRSSRGSSAAMLLGTAPVARQPQYHSDSDASPGRPAAVVRAQGAHGGGLAGEVGHPHTPRRRGPGTDASSVASSLARSRSSRTPRGNTHTDGGAGTDSRGAWVSQQLTPSFRQHMSQLTEDDKAAIKIRRTKSKRTFRPTPSMGTMVPQTRSPAKSSGLSETIEDRLLDWAARHRKRRNEMSEEQEKQKTAVQQRKFLSPGSARILRRQEKKKKQQQMQQRQQQQGQQEQQPQQQEPERPGRTEPAKRNKNSGGGKAKKQSVFERLANMASPSQPNWKSPDAPSSQASKQPRIRTRTRTVPASKPSAAVQAAISKAAVAGAVKAQQAEEAREVVAPFISAPPPGKMRQVWRSRVFDAEVDAFLISSGLDRKNGLLSLPQFHAMLRSMRFVPPGKPIEWADRSELLRARRFLWHDLLRVANAGIEDGEEELDVVPVPLVTHALRCAAVTGKFDQLVSRQLLLHAKPLARQWQSRTKAQSNTQDATPPHRSRRKRRRRASQRVVLAGARGEVGGGAGDGGDSYDGGSSDSSIGSFPDDEAPIPGMDRSPGELIADSSRRFKELQDRVSTVIEKIHDDRVARVNAEAVLHAESQRASKSDPSVQDPAHRGTVRSPVVDTLDLSDMEVVSPWDDGSPRGGGYARPSHAAHQPTPPRLPISPPAPQPTRTVHAVKSGADSGDTQFNDYRAARHSGQQGSPSRSAPQARKVSTPEASGGQESPPASPQVSAPAPTPAPAQAPAPTPSGHGTPPSKSQLATDSPIAPSPMPSSLLHSVLSKMLKTGGAFAGLGDLNLAARPPAVEATAGNDEAKGSDVPSNDQHRDHHNGDVADVQSRGSQRQPHPVEGDSASDTGAPGNPPEPLGVSELLALAAEPLPEGVGTGYSTPAVSSPAVVSISLHDAGGDSGRGDGAAMVAGPSSDASADEDADRVQQMLARAREDDAAHVVKGFHGVVERMERARQRRREQEAAARASKQLDLPAVHLKALDLQAKMKKLEHRTLMDHATAVGRRRRRRGDGQPARGDSDASDGDSSPDAEPKGEPVLDVRPAGYKQTVQRLRKANTAAQRRRQALSLRGTGSPPVSPAKSAKKRAVARDSNGRLKTAPFNLSTTPVKQAPPAKNQAPRAAKLDNAGAAAKPTSLSKPASARGTKAASDEAPRTPKRRGASNNSTSRVPHYALATASSFRLLDRSSTDDSKHASPRRGKAPPKRKVGSVSAAVAKPASPARPSDTRAVASGHASAPPAVASPTSKPAPTKQRQRSPRRPVQPTRLPEPVSADVLHQGVKYRILVRPGADVATIVGQFIATHKMNRAGTPVLFIADKVLAPSGSEAAGALPTVHEGAPVSRQGSRVVSWKPVTPDQLIAALQQQQLQGRTS